MGGAKTFTRGWSICCSQVGVDGQGSDIKGVVSGLIKEQLEKFVDVVQVELPKMVPSMHDVQPQLDLVLGSNVPNHSYDIKSPKKLEELGKQVEVSLSESFALFHEEEEPLGEINILDSFALFDDISTYHVFDESPEDKVFDFCVEPIDYVDFIGIYATLSNYSNQNCDEIYMVEDAFLSKIERVFVSFLGCGRTRHERSMTSLHIKGVCGDIMTTVKVFR